MKLILFANYDKNVIESTKSINMEEIFDTFDISFLNQFDLDLSDLVMNKEKELPPIIFTNNFIEKINSIKITLFSVLYKDFSYIYMEKLDILELKYNNSNINSNVNNNQDNQSLNTTQHINNNNKTIDNIDSNVNINTNFNKIEQIILDLNKIDFSINSVKYKINKFFKSMKNEIDILSFLLFDKKTITSLGIVNNYAENIKEALVEQSDNPRKLEHILNKFRKFIIKHKNQFYKSHFINIGLFSDVKDAESVFNLFVEKKLIKKYNDRFIGWLDLLENDYFENDNNYYNSINDFLLARKDIDNQIFNIAQMILNNKKIAQIEIHTNTPRKYILLVCEALFNSEINCFENTFIPYLNKYNPGDLFFKPSKLLSIQSINYLKNKIDKTSEKIDDKDLKIFKEKFYSSYLIIKESKKQNVYDFLITTNSIDEHKKEILLDKFSGKTLEEIGKNNNLTRERVRQIINNAIKKDFPITLELKHIDFFETYDLSPDVFQSIFSLPIHSYYFLQTISEKPSIEKKDEIEILNEPYINNNTKELIKRKYNLINLDGKFVRNKPINILEYILKKYKDVMNIYELEKVYNELFYKGGHCKQKMNRGYLERIGDSYCVLSGLNHTFRYYDISLVDQELIDELKEIYASLSDGFYSTNFIFKKYPDLMNKLGLINQYELHNLSRKLLSDKYKFTRMPGFLIGYKNKIDFYKNLLLEFSPISIDDFCKMIETDYGCDFASLKGSITKDLQPYLNNGIFSITFDKFDDQSKIEQLKEKLKINNIYTFDEIKSIFTELKIDLKHFNSNTMNMVGFYFNKTSCVRHKYSIESIYKDILLKNGVYKNELYRYTNRRSRELLAMELLNFNCVEISKDVIVSIDHLEKNIGTSKQQIINLINEIHNKMVEHKLFTIGSISKLINFKEIGLDFLEDEFLVRLISRDSRLSFSEWNNNFVMYYKNSSYTIYDFIIEIIKDKEWISLDDLVDYINAELCTNFTYTWIKSKIKEQCLSSCYFVDSLDMVFNEKESYFKYLFE